MQPTDQGCQKEIRNHLLISPSGISTSVLKFLVGVLLIKQSFRRFEALIEAGLLLFCQYNRSRTLLLFRGRFVWLIDRLSRGFFYFLLQLIRGNNYWLRF